MDAECVQMLALLDDVLSRSLSVITLSWTPHTILAPRTAGGGGWVIHRTAGSGHQYLGRDAIWRAGRAETNGGKLTVFGEKHMFPSLRDALRAYLALAG